MATSVTPTHTTTASRGNRCRTDVNPLRTRRDPTSPEQWRGGVRWLIAGRDIERRIMNVVRRGDFGKDTGLQTRMAVTMFLLGLLYAVLIAVAVTAGLGILGVVALFAVLCGAQLFAADKIALRATGAREVSPGDAPELQAIIDRLCLQANIPRPRVALVNSPMPNAFALGRSQKTATVCVTTGLLSTLTPEQLEGVIAHELTHVINRDVMVMTLASFFAS